MWHTTRSCNECEKVSIFLQSHEPIRDLEDLPSTYDTHEQSFVWKFHEFMAYIIVPRMIDGTLGVVDLYLCIDGEDSERIDVGGYAKRFLRERVFPQWPNFEIVYISDPTRASSPGVKCRKIRLQCAATTK